MNKEDIRKKSKHIWMSSYTGLMLQLKLSLGLWIIKAYLENL
jgi:hypothetical protein